MKQKILLVMVIIIAMTTMIGCNKKNPDKINESKNETIDIKDEDNNKNEYLDSIQSDWFDYSYNVKINSIKENDEYISVVFNIDITPKKVEKFNEISAIAYINEDIQQYMAVKGLFTFGILEEDPISIDMNDPEQKGFSISRVTWLYKDTNIDELINDLNSGMKLNVKWSNGEENVNIKDVKIEKFD